MKNNLIIWRNQRGLRIEDLVGVLKDPKGSYLNKQAIYYLGRGVMNEQHISDLDNKFNLTDDEKRFLLNNAHIPMSEVKQPLTLSSTNHDLMYVITLKEKTLSGSDTRWHIGKDLLRTCLFTEITHHQPLDYNREQDYLYYLILCKTRITNTEARTIDDFLKKIEPLIKEYQDRCKDKEINATLYSSGYGNKQT